MKDPVIDETSELCKKARWYIVHTYSGFEQRVQKTINELRRTGQDEGLIEEVGRDEGIGRAILYGTTAEFLNYFGLTSLDQLPAFDILPITENEGRKILKD